MKKFIEVEETTTAPTSSSPSGFYYYGGGLWLVHGGSALVLGMSPNIPPYLLSNTTAGLDFITICRFIAIGADVSNAKAFAEGKG